MTIYQNFGLKIRTERKIRHFTQEDLARRVSVTSSYISMIEKGKKNVSLRLITKLAQALNLPITDFFQ